MNSLFKTLVRFVANRLIDLGFYLVEKVDADLDVNPGSRPGDKGPLEDDHDDLPFAGPTVIITPEARAMRVEHSPFVPRNGEAHAMIDLSPARKNTPDQQREIDQALTRNKPTVKINRLSQGNRVG